MQLTTTYVSPLLGGVQSMVCLRADLIRSIRWWFLRDFHCLISGMWHVKEKWMFLGVDDNTDFEDTRVINDLITVVPR